MKYELYQRRQRTLDLAHRKLLVKKEINKLAKEFKVKPGTIQTDYSRRDIWLPQMAQIEQGRSDFLMIFNSFDSTRALAYRTYDAAMKTNNYAVAVGALKLVLDVDVKASNLRQSLGVLERVPVEYKVEQIQNIRKAVVFFIDIVEKENPALLPELLKIVKNTEDLKKVNKKFIEKGR